MRKEHPSHMRLAIEEIRAKKRAKHPQKERNKSKKEKPPRKEH